MIFYLSWLSLFPLATFPSGLDGDDDGCLSAASVCCDEQQKSLLKLLKKDLLLLFEEELELELECRVEFVRLSLGKLTLFLS